MEIRLGTIEYRYPNERASVHFEDKISIREFRAIERVLDEIIAYQANQRLIDIVLLNDREIHSFFVDTFQTLLEQSVSWAGVKNQQMEEIHLHTNRLLLNYLSSVRTYLDHSLTFLTRKYGHNSVQVTKFNTLLSSNFDNHFSYRFFYKLRNYSQHCGVPIERVSFTSDYDKENHVINGRLNAFFEPQQLLADFDAWGKVKADLLNMPAPFDLRNILEDMTVIMSDIHDQVKKINAAKTNKAAKYLYKKILHLDTDNKETCVFCNIETDEKGHLTKFENIPIPIDQIKKILGEKRTDNK